MHNNSDIKESTEWIYEYNSQNDSYDSLKPIKSDSKRSKSLNNSIESYDRDSIEFIKHYSNVSIENQLNTLQDDQQQRIDDQKRKKRKLKKCGKFFCCNL